MVALAKDVPFQLSNFMVSNVSYAGYDRWQVGGFNPFENFGRIGSFPQVGVKIKNIWNHHLDKTRSTIDPPMPSARVWNFDRKAMVWWGFYTIWKLSVLDNVIPTCTYACTGVCINVRM